MAMTPEEIKQMNKGMERLRGHAIRVSQMSDQKAEAAQKYIEQNSFWLNGDGTGLGFLEEGGEYRVLEVKVVVEKPSFGLRIKLLKLNSSPASG